MYAQNAIVRTYCPGVRVGNWFESIALEEVGCCHNYVAVKRTPGFPKTRRNDGTTELPTEQQLTQLTTPKEEWINKRKEAKKLIYIPDSLVNSQDVS